MVFRMSIWSRIAAALSALATGEGLSTILDQLRSTPNPERSVAFTIAVIALGAKMAKADGTVTRNEVTAFRQVFAIPPADEAKAARVFNLARQDVAGYDIYAAKIRAMFRDQDSDLLIDLMESLFHIALADGTYHPRENEFLMQVSTILGLDDRAFRQLRARVVEGAPRDPYDVLGVTPNTPLEAIRAAWRHAVKTSHPDLMLARGVPPEALKLAERRLQAVNEAWAAISQRAA
jgi:DnaJ like chaperone protein